MGPTLGAAGSRLPLWIAAAVTAGLLWALGPTLVEIAARWQKDAEYSHGFLVPLFSAYLLYARRSSASWEAFRPSWYGLLVLLAGLALHFAGVHYYIEWLSYMAILPCMVAVCLLAGGLAALRWAWPAVAFLIFMIPLPYAVEIALAAPLQRAATVASTYVLQTLGFVAFADGNVIRMRGIEPLGVEEACSGLSMLLVFFALCTAVVLVVRRPWYEKLIILASAIPIALFANIVRITATAVLYRSAGKYWGDLVFHDLAGWLMMPLALLVLLLELRIMAWIVIPGEAGGGSYLAPPQVRHDSRRPRGPGKMTDIKARPPRGPGKVTDIQAAPLNPGKANGIRTDQQ
jgi:exosortase